MAEGKSMDHQNIKEKLLTFHDPELREEERLEIAVHVSSCMECKNTLKRWEMIASAFNRTQSIGSSEVFVDNVMSRLAHLEEVEVSVLNRLALPKWLLPILGYGFALFLMFVAITHRELPVNTETVLLSSVPQTSHWTFGTESPDVNKLVGLS